MNAHYDKLAARYEQVRLDPMGTPYEQWLADQVRRHLDLAPEHRLLDLGGGTGTFAADLRTSVGLQPEVLCVDLSAAMLTRGEGRPGIRLLCSDIAQFCAESTEQVDRALLKEVIHHIPPPARVQMYGGLRRMLAPGGRLLTVTRPQRVSYPLFQRALDLWAQGQPAAEELAQEQERAGFRVTVESAVFPMRVNRLEWRDRVASRFWSTLSAFDDAALEAGLRELDERFGEQEELAFDERLIFIVAEASGCP